MNFSGELEKIPAVRDSNEVHSLVDRAFSTPQAMIDCMLANLSDDYEAIVTQYPYLEDRDYHIPPSKIDWGMAAAVADKIRHEDDISYVESDLTKYEPYIVEQPAEVPTIEAYAKMLRKYWNIDGCTSCGMCEMARYGSRTKNLIKHQSRVVDAAVVSAILGEDDAVVAASENSIIDGLRAHTLRRALEVNRFLPRTLAQLELLLGRENYIPLDARKELVMLHGPKMMGIEVLNYDKLRSRADWLFPDAVLDPAERLKQYRTAANKDSRQLAIAQATGLNPVPLALELESVPVDFSYAVGWLSGFREVAGSQGQFVAPRLNPDRYERANTREEDDMTAACYALAYLDLGAHAEAWLHGVSIHEPSVRLEVMHKLAEGGNSHARLYLKELQSGL